VAADPLAHQTFDNRPDLIASTSTFHSAFFSTTRFPASPIWTSSPTRATSGQLSCYAGSGAAALDADVPTARQILKRILVGRVYVRPVRPGAWRFAGISRYDGALRGGPGRTGTTVLPGFGPRYDDFCQLMLHLLAEPKSAADGDDQSRQQSLFGLCTEHRPRGPVDGARVARIIAGGSDAAGWHQTGRVSAWPP
jgi:hypothetical protein